MYQSGRLNAADVEKKRNEPLSERVMIRLQYVAVLYPTSTDWLEVKKKIMLELPIYDRQLFSTRDQLTMKHHPFNVYERKIREAWLSLTGNLLLMPEHKKLEPNNDKGYE